MNTLYFVAHRGLMQECPENSMLAFVRALEAGGVFLECDVHLSRDQIPVVIHDAELIRTSGLTGSVFDFDAKQLQEISVGYPDKFSERFADQKIPLLSELVQLLNQWPAAKLFVELKRRSLNHYGRELMLQKVLEQLVTVRDRVIIISFDYHVLEMAKRQGVESIGWVIERWDSQTRTLAERLKPDFLFGDYHNLPTEGKPFWAGPWRWVIYDVVNPQIAADLIARGVMVESRDIKSLIKREG